MGRTATVERKTSETDITVTLDLDGEGRVDVETGVPFFDHMLDAFGRHALLDLEVRAAGDVEVDAHHTVEDVGITLGQAVAEALGDKAGIRRFGSAVVPMDEALVMCAIDVSGRPHVAYELEVPIEVIGSFDTTLAKEFVVAFAQNADITVHVRGLSGTNAHHLVEAAFKSCARAFREAVSLDPRVSGVPSTKGTL